VKCWFAIFPTECRLQWWARMRKAESLQWSPECWEDKMYGTHSVQRAPILCSHSQYYITKSLLTAPSHSQLGCRKKNGSDASGYSEYSQQIGPGGLFSLNPWQAAKGSREKQSWKGIIRQERKVSAAGMTNVCKGRAEGTIWDSVYQPSQPENP